VAGTAGLNSPAPAHRASSGAQHPDLGRDLAERSWHDPSKITDDLWSGYRLPLKAENWDRAFWEFLLASEPLDVTGRLGELTMPILVITGDDDRVVPTEQTIQLAGGWKNARLVVLPECGHVPQEECPGALLEAIDGFVDKLELPKAVPSTVPRERKGTHEPTHPTRHPGPRF